MLAFERREQQHGDEKRDRDIQGPGHVSQGHPRLGIHEKSRLLFVLEGDSVRLVQIGRRTLAELAGSISIDEPWPGMAAAREAYRRR